MQCVRTFIFIQSPYQYKSIMSLSSTDIIILTPRTIITHSFFKTLYRIHFIIDVISDIDSLKIKNNHSYIRYKFECKKYPIVMCFLNVAAPTAESI